MCWRPMVSLKRSGTRSRRRPRRLGVWKRETRTCSGNLCRSGSSIVREFFLPEHAGEQRKRGRRLIPGEVASDSVEPPTMGPVHLCAHPDRSTTGAPGPPLSWTPAHLRPGPMWSANRHLPFRPPAPFHPPPSQHTQPPPGGATPPPLSTSLLRTKMTLPTLSPHRQPCRVRAPGQVGPGRTPGAPAVATRELWSDHQGSRLFQWTRGHVSGAWPSEATTWRRKPLKGSGPGDGS